MLPNILDIAHEHQITFDAKNYGKKETLAKCPFCKADQSMAKRKTYYLSLNTKDQVYKCWFCGESGGVLRFEAKLSDCSFSEVREKYFGKRKHLHPAFQLSPEQLEAIDWLSIKQRNFKAFQNHTKAVLHDWKRYVYHEQAKHFALFMCMAHLENQKQKQKESFAWFIEKCREKPIPNLYRRIHGEYVKPAHRREAWANHGVKMARVAWKTSIDTCDMHLDNLYVHVLFIDYFLKSEIKNRHSQDLVVSSL